MKYLSLLLISLSAQATVYEYKEVVRRYKNLDQLDLTRCEKSYRFINDNWMDCTFNLPDLIHSPVAQISNLNIQRRELTTAQADGLEYFTRIETSYRDMDEASSTTKLSINSYYGVPGVPRIHTAPADLYSFSIFQEQLRNALAGWKPQGTTLIAYNKDLKSKFIDDEVKGSVFFGEKTSVPDADRCVKNYEHDQEDNWPETEEIWYSQCSYYDQREFFYLSLRNHWSEKLQSHSLEEEKLIALSGGKIAKVTHSAAGFSIQLGNDTAQGPDFNLDLTPEAAAPLIREAAEKAGTMKAHFFILERNLNTLNAKEKILGKLGMKRLRLKDEIDLIPASEKAKL